MRALLDRNEPGLLLSGVAHAAILIGGLVAFVGVAPLPPVEEGIPIELVTESDLSQITRGERDAQTVTETPTRVDRVAEVREEAPAGEDRRQVDVAATRTAQTPVAERAQAGSPPPPPAAAPPPPPPPPPAPVARPEPPAPAAPPPPPVAEAPPAPTPPAPEAPTVPAPIVAEAAENAVPVPLPPSRSERARAQAEAQSRIAQEHERARQQQAQAQAQQQAQAREAERRREEERRREAQAQQQRQQQQQQAQAQAQAREQRERAEREARAAADRRRREEEEARASRVAEEASRFNPTDIASLLRSTDNPAATGASGPELARTASLGTATGTASRLSPSLRDQLIGLINSQLRACWDAPLAAQSMSNPPVAVVRFSLSPEGGLTAGPDLVNSSSDPLFGAVADSALRAVQRCAPLRIPAQFAPYYDDWRTLSVNFNPLEAS